jgi:CubicO group peptidase (beta-lactamase class C family)
MQARILAAVLLFSSLATPVCAQSPTVNAQKAGMDAEVLARIPVMMRSYVEKGRIAGAVTLVARHGTVASLEAVGFQDIETRKAMRTDTIFQIMSMTKPITAVALMILAEEGKLSLSDPVGKYLPECKGMWMVESRDGDKSMALKRPSRPVTIRDLLTHTSGFPPTPPGAFRPFEVWDTTPMDKLVAITAQQPLDFEPGSRFEYSSMGFEAVGRVIEVLSGMPFDQFLATRLFTPLGMKDTFFFPPPDKYDRIASVYVLRDGKVKPVGNDNPGGGNWKYRKGSKNPLPDGGLYTTAPDLFALYQMMLNGGTYQGKRILSPVAVELMTTSLTGDIPVWGESGQGYGLGWLVNRDPRASFTLPFTSIGTFSHAGRFSTEGWVDPKRDLVGIFLIQREPYTTEERDAFMSIVASAILRQIPEHVP